MIFLLYYPEFSIIFIEIAITSIHYIYNWIKRIFKPALVIPSLSTSSKVINHKNYFLLLKNMHYQISAQRTAMWTRLFSCLAQRSEAMQIIPILRYLIWTVAEQPRKLHPNSRGKMLMGPISRLHHLKEGGGWEGKGGQIRGDRRRLDFRWWAHSRVHRCHIMKVTPDIYVMSLTSVTSINLIKYC